MIVALGACGAVLYCWGLGTLLPDWPGQGRWQAWLGTIAQALWLSWLLVWVSLLLHVANLFWIGWAAVLAVALIRRRVPRAAMPYPAGRLGRFLTTVVVVGCVGLLWSAARQFATPEGLFVDWDAVISWNRWAIELADNQYHPVGAAYPILFPGIWSLIYKAQGTSAVWFVAKTSLYVLPLACLLALAALAEQGLLLSSLLASAALAWMLAAMGPAVLSGYMDAPVALLILVSGLAMLMVGSRPWPASPWGLQLVTVSTLVAITLVTKQAGVVLLSPYLAILAHARRHGGLRWRGLAAHLAIIGFPLLSYLGLYLQHRANPVGNLGLLRDLAAQSAGDTSPVVAAFQGLMQGWSGLALVGLLLLAALNGRRPAALSSQLGLIFLAEALGGFFIYAHCCSYDSRNGWWLYALVAVAACCGVSQRDRRLFAHLPMRPIAPLPRRRIAGASALALAGASLWLSWAFPDARVLAQQQALQWQVGVPAVSSLVQQHASAIAPQTRLITTYIPARILPGMAGPYVWCQNRRPDVQACIAQASAHHTSFLLRRSSDYSLLPATLLQPFLLAEASGYQLYGPFPPGWLGRAQAQASFTSP